MPFNGSGVYSLPVNSFNPAVPATALNSGDWNVTGPDIATGLTATLTKDGQSTATARIPFALGAQTDSITELTATNGVTIGKVNAALGSDVASATTINLTTATGQTVDVTGTTAITAVTLGQGSQRWVRFTGILTLTHGASLVLPGAANITTAAGDYALFVGYAAGVVRCADYQRASGSAVVSGVTSVTAADASITVAGTAAAPTISRAALTGDITATAGSNATTLATVNANVGSFTNASVTVNAKGLVTAAASGGSTITLGTQVNASSTSVDFTGIPSTVKRIAIMYANISTNGTSNLMVQIGDSGGFETSGYASQSRNNVGATANTTGFITTGTIAAAHVLQGVVELLLSDAATFAWTSCHTLADSTSAVGPSNGGGSKSLSATLDRIRITTVGGTDTFDAGTLNIQYM